MLVSKYLKLYHEVDNFDFDSHDEESAEDIANPDQAQAGGKNKI